MNFHYITGLQTVRFYTFMWEYSHQTCSILQIQRQERKPYLKTIHTLTYRPTNTSYIDREGCEWSEELLLEGHSWQIEYILISLHPVHVLYFLTSYMHVFVCQVGDGNPLRRWRVSVELSATPTEVLQRLLKERPLWQVDLQQEKVLETLDKQTDVYQYSCRNMAPQPSCDYVVLR